VNDKTLERMLNQAFTRGYQAARNGKPFNVERKAVVEGLFRFRDQYASPLLASSEPPTQETDHGR
jgi:hypothetical protein